jgi:hypothetical protein
LATRKRFIAIYIKRSPALDGRHDRPIASG